MSQNTRFDYFPVSVHLFFRNRDSLLMIRRYGTGYCDGMYSVPAGHVDQSESVLEAAIREAQEEVGLIVLPENIRVVGTMYRRSTEARIDFFLEVDQWSGEPRNSEPHKCSEVAWFPNASLPENTIPYLRWALQHAGQTPWFGEYQL